MLAMKTFLESNTFPSAYKDQKAAIKYKVNMFKIDVTTQPLKATNGINFFLDSVSSIRTKIQETSTGGPSAMLPVTEL